MSHPTKSAMEAALVVCDRFSIPKSWAESIANTYDAHAKRVRLATIEKCAKVAEEWRTRQIEFHRYAHQRGALDIAAEIRAIAAKTISTVTITHRKRITGSSFS